MAGGARHQRHRRVQLQSSGCRADARPALRQDRQRRQPSGVPAGLRHRELRGEQGRARRAHQVRRRGPRPLQRQRQRRRTRLREDGAAGQAAAGSARARRARVGAGPRGRAGGCGTRDHVPVQRGGATHHGTGDRGGRWADARFLKITGAGMILRAVINPLKNNYLVRGARCVVACAAVAGCGGRRHVGPPEPTAPLPTAGIASQQVSVLPLTLLAAEDSLHWENALGQRRAGLAKADSVFGALLQARAPEVSWVLPDELRRAARRAPGIAPDPDQMGTAILLRGGKLEVVPDPLRSELRTLAALAGSGGGRRSLGGADARREKPHARAAVTGGRGGHAATLIVGDGIGPEITQATLLVLDALGVAFDWDEQYGGMSAIDKAGTPLPDATLESIRRTGLALKGPLTTPVGGGYRSVNVALRQEFDLYANVRPVK